MPCPALPYTGLRPKAGYCGDAVRPPRSYHASNASPALYDPPVQSPIRRRTAAMNRRLLRKPNSWATCCVPRGRSKIPLDIVSAHGYSTFRNLTAVQNSKKGNGFSVISRLFAILRCVEAHYATLFLPLPLHLAGNTRASPKVPCLAEQLWKNKNRCNDAFSY